MSLQENWGTPLNPGELTDQQLVPSKAFCPQPGNVDNTYRNNPTPTPGSSLSH